ncbi:MAG: hypothetical protein ABH954_04320 [Candidatus Omnitrophota bacterium]
MDRGIPPEERLLRLIRGRKDSDEKPRTAEPVKKKILVDSNLSKPFNKFFKNKIVPSLNFKFLNILLVSVLIMFLSYLVLHLFIPSQSRIIRISESVRIEEKKDKADIQISQPKDYEYYNKQFAKRDIFNAPLLDKATGTPTASSQQAIQDFKLVGIVLDDQPQVILENSATKETHFLNKGESLDRIEIKDILESKVIVIYGGEEIELEL